MTWKLLSLTAVFALIAGAAQATPTLYHNPQTGNLTLMNDLVGEALFPIVFIQVSGDPVGLASPGANPIPGSLMDEYDLPARLAFIKVPLGTFDLGSLLSPGVPSSQVTLNYTVRAATPSEYLPGQVATVPEPAAIVSCVAAVLGFATLRRRK